MRQRRGQAFETMMLVISVIVAVAILSILLGFIGRIGPGIGGDAITTMKTQLKNVQGSGYGSSSIEKATFSEGTIRTGTLITDLPLAASDIQFVWVLNGICGSESNSPLNCEPAKITVNNKIQGYITTCKGNGPYNIVIGSENQKSEVSKKCDACVEGTCSSG